MLVTGIRIVPTDTANFLMESQVKQAPKKELIKHSDDSFDEVLAMEMRLLDVNYIRTMSLLGGK